MSKSVKSIISHKHKYIYFYVPKVACTSIRNLLAIGDGLKWYHPWDKTQTKFEYIYLQDSNNKKYDNYFKFAFVRNPWDRLVSCYFDKVVGSRTRPDSIAIKNGEYIQFKKRYKKNFKTMTFPEFVCMVKDLDEKSSNGHFRSQHTFMNKEKLNFIGRFEQLQVDLNVVKKKFDLPNDVKHLLKSSHKDYKEYYDEKLKNIVAERFKKDIELFGYTF